MHGEMVQLKAEIREMRPEDRDSVKHLIDKTPQFTNEEKQCAIDLVDAFIRHGIASGYDILVSIGHDNKLLGYTCFGKIPLTDANYDIYWLVVEPSLQNKGFGTQLLRAIEEKLTDLFARKMFAETSSQKHYLSAQNFYQKSGFRLVSYIQDFYKIGDGKLVFVKNIERRET